MERETCQPRLHIRIVFGDHKMIGPGKAELLERIDCRGSIAATAREMGISCKRAWQPVGTLKAMFCAPLADSPRGGPGGGGGADRSWSRNSGDVSGLQERCHCSGFGKSAGLAGASGKYSRTVSRLDPSSRLKRYFPANISRQIPNTSGLQPSIRHCCRHGVCCNLRSRAGTGTDQALGRAIGVRP